MTTATTDLLSTPTGEIAVRSPAASRVFHRHRIDYCCGGKKPLGESCASAGADPRQVLAELAAAEATPADERWDGRPLVELVEHIATVYHEPLRLELARLEFMSQKVARVHGPHHPAMIELAAVVARFAAGLGQHLDKEDKVLFPWIRTGQGASAAGPITAMLHEHEAHARELAAIRACADGFRPWDGACNTVRALYLGLAALERDLMQHIHLENNILFPRALAGGQG